MKKKALKGVLLIAITIIAMTSCSTMRGIEEGFISSFTNTEIYTVNLCFDSFISEEIDKTLIITKKNNKIVEDENYLQLIEGLQASDDLEFKYWRTDLSSYPYTFHYNFQDEHNITLYGYWENTKEVNVFFKPNTSTYEGVHWDEVKKTNTLVVQKPLNTPVKKGYTFAGWYSDEALTKEYLFNTKREHQNLTLYAKWIDSEPQTEERLLYLQAQKEGIPELYTSKYPNGKYNVSDIPNNKLDNAFSTALDSLEQAKQFQEDYPDSKYEEQINTYIIREEWFTSETYLNALKDIPEEMMNSQLMIREGILDLRMTFKEFFIDRAPILDYEIIKSGNDITVIYKGPDNNKFTFTVNVFYSSLYGGMMYIDTIKLSQGLFSREVYRTFEEKASNLVALNAIYI